MEAICIKARYHVAPREVFISHQFEGQTGARTPNTFHVKKNNNKKSPHQAKCGSSTRTPLENERQRSFVLLGEAMQTASKNKPAPPSKKKPKMPPSSYRVVVVLALSMTTLLMAVSAEETACVKLRKMQDEQECSGHVIMNLDFPVMTKNGSPCCTCMVVS